MAANRRRISGLVATAAPATARRQQRVGAATARQQQRGGSSAAARRQPGGSSAAARRLRGSNSAAATRSAIKTSEEGVKGIEEKPLVKVRE
ncbi:hypothetical protein LINPERPRIM_LOCUS33713 [Linum perenne]